ncbi:MAG: LamG domain-containing protein, partial [Nanoarchaeota archaeon]|nr:LamG domain-containing protein [Nanoarchaeota archaeon]
NTTSLIDFVAPTEANNTKVTSFNNENYVNVSITEASNNYSAFIDWNRSLVGWWRLEDTNGTFFADSSTWGNNGTCDAAADDCPNLTTGMRGKAYRFDGSDDYITIPSDSTFNSTSTFSLLIWARNNKATINSIEALAAKDTISGSNREWSIVTESSNNNIYFRVFNATTGAAPSGGVCPVAFTPDNWNLFALVWDGTTLRGSVNVASTCVGTGFAEGRKLGAVDILIGTHTTSQRRWNGTIDEVMFWDRNLTVDEINATYNAFIGKLYRNFTGLSSGTYTYKAYVVDQAGNLNNTEQRTFIVNAAPVVSSVLVNSTYGTNLTTENLTAYVTSSDNDSDAYTLIYDWRKNGVSDAVLNMPFDVNGSNGNTSNVKDYSSYGNNGTHNGTASNMPRWNASCGAFSGSGGCYEFDGIDDIIYTSGAATKMSPAQGTVSVWLKANDAATGGAYVVASDLNTRTYITRSSGVFYVYKGEPSVYVALPASAANTWYQIVLTWDNSTNMNNYTMKGYQNGVLSDTKNFTNGNAGSFLRFGAFISGIQHFNGSIDNAVVWNRSLSASEISMLYNSGIGMYNRTHSDATTAGDIWYAVVTPADKYEDGTPVASNNVTIASAYTYVNLTSPLDGWYVNNTVKFECFASSNIPLVNISLWHNNTQTWHRSMTVSTTANSAIAHFVNSTLSTNNFIWTCQACTAEGCTASTENRTLRVDIINPNIEFHSSSVLNNTKRPTYYNEAYVNTTITEASNNYSAFIDWNRSLVGWWRLENTNGTWFEDSSSWGNNGTCTNCPNLTTGMRGKAYKFDGSNDYISINVSAARSDIISVFTWIKPSTVSTGRQDIIKSGNSGTYATNNWILGLTTSSIRVYGDTTNIATGTGVINAEQWQHIGFVANGTYVKIYVNGEQKADSALTINNGNTDGEGIGYGGAYTNGTIDEVMVFTRALSPEEINATYSAGIWKLYHNFTSLYSGTYTYKAYVVDQAGNLNSTEQRIFIVNSIPTHDYPTINTTYGTNLTTENITAFNVSTADADNDAVTNIWNWYRNNTNLMLFNAPFEGGSTNGTLSANGNGTFTDYSGLTTARAVINNITWAPNAGVDGRGAYNFTGENSTIEIYGYQEPRYQVSLEAWIKPGSCSGYQKIIHKEYTAGSGATAGAYSLSIYGTAYLLEGYFGVGGYPLNYSRAYALNNCTAGKWTHLVGVLDNGISYLYVDGDLKVINNTHSGKEIKQSGTTVLNIGSFNKLLNDYGYYKLASGTILDIVRIYNASLTAEQILALYQNKTNFIHSSMTSAGETWSACLTPNDGQDDGATMCTRANITINTPPTKVILDTPTHGNITMTNRSVSFRWLAVADTDGDSVSYNISIKCYQFNTSSCSPSDDRMYNTTATSLNLTEAQGLYYLRDDQYYYNWSVIAYDGKEYGTISNQSNFSLISEVILNLINDTVNFSVMAPGAWDNTTDNSPKPLLIENRGNVLTTINISSATRLFTSASAPMPSAYYLIMANETSGYEGAFSQAGSQMSWAQVPAVNMTLINKLNYTTSKDRANIHVHVQVPSDEPSGAKSSILTITGWYAG